MSGWKLEENNKCAVIGAGLQEQKLMRGFRMSVKVTETARALVRAPHARKSFNYPEQPHLGPQPCVLDQTLPQLHCRCPWFHLSLAWFPAAQTWLPAWALDLIHPFTSPGTISGPCYRLAVWQPCSCCSQTPYRSVGESTQQPQITHSIPMTSELA